jgi:hypothetical protein
MPVRNRTFLPAIWCLAVSLASASPAQHGGKQTARDLFYSEAGLMVSSRQGRQGRFAAAKKSVVAVALGLRYVVWKVSGEQAVSWDPDGPFAPGDHIRLGIEINDTGYLYIVHRQASGMWRRVFPTPELEHGNHFIHSGVMYPVPPEGGLELKLSAGPERLLVVLSRVPVRELEALVSAPQPENTVSAALPPEIADAIVAKIRSLVNPKDLLTDRQSSEKAVYVVNRTGKPDSLVISEISCGNQ